MAAITTQEFEHHFKSLYKPLCLFALRYTDQVDDAEDIVQQAFADVWDKNRAGNVIGNLKAYLYQAVRNRSLSFTSQPVNAEATEQLPDVEDTSEEEDILRSERDARLWDAIDQLPLCTMCDGGRGCLLIVRFMELVRVHMGDGKVRVYFSIPFPVII